MRTEKEIKEGIKEIEHELLTVPKRTNKHLALVSMGIAFEWVLNEKEEK